MLMPALDETAAMPTLSVVMPNYNYGQFLAEALDAVLAQSHQPREIILLDDASTDGGVQIMRRYANREPRIQVHVNERNRGNPYTVNRGFRLASSDFVSGIGPDDPVLPGFFEQSLDLLAGCPSAGFSCAQYRVLFPDGRFGGSPALLVEEARYVSPDEFRAWVARQPRFAFATSTVLWKRAAFEAAGGFPVGLKWHGDWFLSLVLAFRHGFCYLPRVLQTVRHNEQGYTNAGRRRWKEQGGVLAELLRLLDSPAFQDVRKDFQIPSVLSRFGWQILPLLARRRGWRHCLTPGFVKLAAQSEPRWMRLRALLRV